MELLDHLILGFGVALTFQNLAWALLGCVLGTAIGVLPGLGPTTTIAMLLPSIYALDATPALIMLAGIYYGAQYGGSTTAILINVPGESSSVVTAIDGYQMARQGRAGAALAAAGLGSFFAGCVGTIIIAAFAPPLTELAFKFGPAEYFSLMVLGLIGAVVLASGSLVKAIAMILLGLLLGQINTDVISGTPRYSFDIPELTDGIGFVAIAMGVFGFGEIIANLGKPAEHREVFTKDVKGLWPTFQDFKNAFPAVLRGTTLGSILGVLADRERRKTQALEQTAHVLQDDPGADAAYVEALEPARSELQRAEAAMTATTAGSPAMPTPIATRLSSRVHVYPPGAPPPNLPDGAIGLPQRAGAAQVVGEGGLVDALEIAQRLVEVQGQAEPRGQGADLLGRVVAGDQIGEQLAHHLGLALVEAAVGVGRGHQQIADREQAVGGHVASVRRAARAVRARGGQPTSAMRATANRLTSAPSTAASPAPRRIERSLPGWGRRASIRRWTLAMAATIASSPSDLSQRSACSGPRRTAGSPAGSMVARSQPLPLMHATSVSTPRSSGSVVLTEVLPPPCSTSAGSRPSRRELYTRRARSSLHPRGSRVV